tara:strand:- start:350 stop:835 length:486 start_codon:yes stop_codon:yes gene_type:complete
MATLTSTVTESVTLNGTARGSSISLSVTGIDDVYHRIVTCIANVDTTVAHFNTQVDVEDAGIDTQNAKYIRVTNLDSSNSVNLNLQVDTTESGSGAAAANETATILLPAGHSFIMCTPHDSIAVYDADASVQTTLHDLESILVDPGTNAVQIEVFVASAVA